MKRHSKKVWQIVSPTVRTKVARLWWNREETTAYLQELYERTIHSRLELQNGAAKVPGSAQWADPRIEADTDLARVYAVAALCIRFNTYKEFETALNHITVRHLASQLTGDPPWLPADLYRAQKLVLVPRQESDHKD